MYISPCNLLFKSKRVSSLLTLKMFYTVPLIYSLKSQKARIYSNKKT